MLSRCRAGSLRAGLRFVLAAVGCWLLVEAPRGWANPGDPPKEAVAKAMESGERAWAYRPVVRPELPETAGAEVSPIDRLLAKRRAEKGVETTSPARPAELLRRLKFDLLGLPPTPEELAAFEADSSDSAYRQWVETWLASPHYGERWGRIWLDLVRYSDTAGYNADPLRPLAWKYRDYVISAFNNDTPYDRFLSEQIAGDELYPKSQAALVGTGFLRLPPDESNASDVVLARQDTLNDLTAAVGSVLLGQSLGCAQCHDHKYDPLAQKEYYSLQAFFAAVIPVEKQVAVSTPEVQAAVAEGRADAAVVATLSPQAIVAAAPKRWFLPGTQPLARTSAAMAVRKGDADFLAFLNTWLDIQREQGWLDERQRHWATAAGATR